MPEDAHQHRKPFTTTISKSISKDLGYDRGGTPSITAGFEPLARVTLFLSYESILGDLIGTA